MMARALAIACLAACISPPVRPKCTDARPLDEVNTINPEYAPWLSHDRLTLLFSASGGVDNTVFVAHRASPSERFGARNQLLDSVNGADRFDSFLSSDGKMLWYVEGSGNGGGDLYQAPIAADDSVGTPVQMFPELGPVLHPTFTSNMLQVFFAAKPIDTHAIFTAKRSSTSVPFEPATSLDAINAGGNDDGPVISRDGETLYFDSPLLGSDGEQHLGYATRAHNFADITALSSVPPVTGGGDSFGSVDDDGRTVVFDSDRPGGAGGFDIWIACE
jgi:Tol biopolymer transport system component